MNSKIKTYRCIPERTNSGGFLVLVDHGNGAIKTLNPKRSQSIYNHSPNGFSWGYEGSGPAQLALALLLDVTDEVEVALKFYQNFKRHVVAIHPMGKSWSITEREISDWLMA